MFVFNMLADVFNTELQPNFGVPDWLHAILQTRSADYNMPGILLSENLPEVTQTHMIT